MIENIGLFNGFSYAVVCLTLIEQVYYYKKKKLSRFLRTSKHEIVHKDRVLKFQFYTNILLVFLCILMVILNMTVFKLKGQSELTATFLISLVYIFFNDIRKKLIKSVDK